MKELGNWKIVIS